MCLKPSVVEAAAAAAVVAKVKAFRLWKVAHFQNSANESD
jgi:hypothetical protein